MGMKKLPRRGTGGKATKGAGSTSNSDYYISRGRCPKCGGARPLEPGKRKCRECLEKSRQSQRERRKARRESGACTRCGKPLPEDSKYLQCEVCRAYVSTFRVFNKRRYEARKAEGRCVKCGEWVDPGKTMCRKCLDDHIAYERKQGDALKEKKRARREGFKAVGLCIDCGSPTDGGHTRCKRCREGRMDSCRKYRINKRFEREAQTRRQNNADNA